MVHRFCLLLEIRHSLLQVFDEQSDLTEAAGKPIEHLAGVRRLRAVLSHLRRQFGDSAGELVDFVGGHVPSVSLLPPDGPRSALPIAARCTASPSETSDMMAAGTTQASDVVSRSGPARADGDRIDVHCQRARGHSHVTNP